MPRPCMPSEILSWLVLLALMAGSVGCRNRGVAVQDFGITPTAAATYAWSGHDRHDGERVAPDARSAALRNSIDQTLSRKGYRQQPAGAAAWHLYYDLLINPRIGMMPTGDAVLQPRMLCGPQDCQIRHEWREADAPGFDPPRYRYREAVLRLVVVEARTQRVTWQASTTREMASGGPLDDQALAAAAEQLAEQLPTAP